MPKSKYIGVCWSESSQKWYARIKHNYKTIYIGIFDSEEAAARAYDDKAFELRGDNTKFNFRNNHHMCEANGCSNQAVTKFQGFWVCAKHKQQLRSKGRFLERTIYDKNEITIDGEFAYISLYDSSSVVIARTKIDKDNVDLVKDYKWYLRPDGYVASVNYNGEYVYLHNVICNKMEKRYVDHKDRDKLNNTSENLREATGSENQMNKGIRKNNTSGKVGVHWSNSMNKWCAMICVEGKHMNLGYFDDYDDAVECRVSAEKKYFKEYRAKDEKSVSV